MKLATLTPMLQELAQAHALHEKLATWIATPAYIGVSPEGANISWHWTEPKMVTIYVTLREKAVYIPRQEVTYFIASLGEWKTLLGEPLPPEFVAFMDAHFKKGDKR